MVAFRTPDAAHPRFSFQPATGRIDGFSERGAQQLARRIRDAWKAVGRNVAVRVERISSEEIGEGRSMAHFTVRSDLVNGMPRREA